MFLYACFSMGMGHMAAGLGILGEIASPLLLMNCGIQSSR